MKQDPFTTTDETLNGTQITVGNEQNRAPRHLYQSIGPYQIIRPIGEGGMGSVFLAQQEQPKRRVAIKVLTNRLSGELQARFKAEGHVLGMMNHHNIARIYETGTTADGLSYFSMEYVDGMPIDRFAKEAGLNLKDRLQLFDQFCDGISFAHRQAVLHRDLKPHNVLVTTETGKPVVKIIDFGLARVMDETTFLDLQSKADSLPGSPTASHQTVAGRVMGTPAYMSPEQLNGEVGLDVRTDVYAAGVILYQLLTDLHPYYENEFKSLRLRSLLDTLKEVEIRRPSERLTDFLVAGGISARRARKVDRVKALRSELDWIALKSLERDIDRRYTTIDMLARDIKAYQRHWPVRAIPPSRTYQIRCFVRRNLWPVATAGVFLVMTLVITGIKVQDLRQTVEQAEALKQEHERTTMMQDLLQEIVGSADPREMGPNTRVIDLMRRLEQEKLATIPDDEVKANMHHILGKAYFGFGLKEEARKYLGRAYAYRRDKLGKTHTSTIETRHWLATCLRSMERYEEALNHFQQLWKIHEYKSGRDNPATLVAIARVAFCEYKLNGNQESRKTLHDVMDELPSTIEGKKEMSWIYHALADSYFLEQTYSNAEGLYRRALQIRKDILREGHPDIFFTQLALVKALRLQEKNLEAVPFAKELYEIGPKIFGPDNPRVHEVVYHLAFSLFFAQELEEAETHAERLFEAFRGDTFEDYWFEAYWILCKVNMDRKDASRLSELYNERHELLKAYESQDYFKDLKGLLQEVHLFVD